MYVCTAQDWTDNGWRGWKGVRLDKDRIGYVWGLCCSCQTEVSFLVFPCLSCSYQNDITMLMICGRPRVGWTEIMNEPTFDMELAMDQDVYPMTLGMI